MHANVLKSPVVRNAIEQMRMYKLTKTFFASFCNFYFSFFFCLSQDNWNFFVVSCCLNFILTFIWKYNNNVKREDLNSVFFNNWMKYAWKVLILYIQSIMHEGLKYSKTQVQLKLQIVKQVRSSTTSLFTLRLVKRPVL